MTPAELDRIEKDAEKERDQHEYSSLFTYSLEHPAEARRCQELDNVLALVAEVRRLQQFNTGLINELVRIIRETGYAPPTLEELDRAREEKP